MKEKLIIKNFGPIKSVELDLGRFNILIGEQATGKSTVAKVLAVCRYFSYIVEGDVLDDIIDGPFLKGLNAWGLSEYIHTSSYIYYSCKHYTLTVEARKIKLTQTTSETQNENGEPILVGSIDHFAYHPKITALSNEFKNLLLELDKIKPKDYKNINRFSALAWTIPTSFFLNDVKNVMDNPFYLPTDRGLQSIFSIGQSSIKNISNSLFNQLARMDQIARLFKQETYIEPLDIYYVNRDGHGFIRKANETQYYSLYNAASGYQAIIPIVLVIKYYTEIRKKSKTFLIEEPELDVFPTTQNKLIQYVSEKTQTYGSMVFITTHSPYTLTSVNNLMYSFVIGQSHPEKVSKIINKKYWLNPEDVSAYMMTPNGSVENIMDEELKQIKAEKIDDVSRGLNKEFDEMLNIEYSK